jgi:hypothetical protein
MDERDLEKLLRRYRPAGPPAELRVRIATTHRAPRTWTWAAAAAALIAVMVGFHVSADRTHAAMSRPSATAGSADAWPALHDAATEREIAALEMANALERAQAQPSGAPAWP